MRQEDDEDAEKDDVALLPPHDVGPGAHDYWPGLAIFTGNMHKCGALDNTTIA